MGKKAGKPSAPAPLKPGTYYHRYIVRENESPPLGLLGLQERYGKGKQSHSDELLFIIIHQTYELWFKLIIEELLRPKTGAVARIKAGQFAQGATTVRRLTKITNILAKQYAIVETITPSDFLVFRDVLRPSSGYDSSQFRAVELASGLRGDAAYLQHLTGVTTPKAGLAEIRRAKAAVRAGREVEGSGYSIVQRMVQAGDINGLELLERALSAESLRDVIYDSVMGAHAHHDEWKPAAISKWLGKRAREWKSAQAEARTSGFPHEAALEAEAAAHIQLNAVGLYQAATRGHLGHGDARALYDLIEALIEYDEAFRNLRSIHVHMVLRVIGGKSGTGGSAGARYLRTTLDYEFFPLLWRARDKMEGP